jgi:hypothetical protein
MGLALPVGYADVQCCKLPSPVPLLSVSEVNKAPAFLKKSGGSLMDFFPGGVAAGDACANANYATAIVKDVHPCARGMLRRLAKD